MPVAHGRRWSLALALLVGCGSANPDAPRDAGAPADVAPDVAPEDAAPIGLARVGSPATLDVATWNLFQFPASPDAPRLVAAAVRELDLDLVALQEVASQAAFDELLRRLPGYTGLLSRPVPADAPPPILVRGFLVRDAVLRVRAQEVLLPLGVEPAAMAAFAVRLSYTAVTPAFEFEAVCVHMKAGQTASDVDLRTRQFARLDELLRMRAAAGGPDHVIVLGDFNQPFFGRDGAAVWAPFAGAADTYTVETRAAALSGQNSHRSGGFLDHVVTTAALDDEVGAREPLVVHAETSVPDYWTRVSDHLPVTLVLAPR